MRNASLTILFAVLTQTALAFDPAYQIPDSRMSEKAFHEISNFPTVRTQDGTPLCYAFSATQLLNYQYCKKNDLDCSHPANQMSVLDVAKHHEFTPTLREGGFPEEILSRIKGYGVHSERCLPFERLAHQNPQKKGDKYGEAYDELAAIYGKARGAAYATKACYAKRVQNILPFSKDTHEIVRLLDQSYGYEEFIYNAAVKDTACRQSRKMRVGGYHVYTFPEKRSGKNPSREEYLEQFEKLLLNDIPVSMKICSEDAYNPDTDSSGELGTNDNCGGHAITVTGIKEVCNFKGCDTLLKVQNSYGQTWQDNYNDGWLEAGPLIKRAKTFEDQGSLVYITRYPKEKLIPQKKLDRMTGGAGASGQNNGNSGSNSSSATMYMCDGALFIDKPIPGKNCRPLR